MTRVRCMSGTFGGRSENSQQFESESGVRRIVFNSFAHISHQRSLPSSYYVVEQCSVGSPLDLNLAVILELRVPERHFRRIAQPGALLAPPLPPRALHGNCSALEDAPPPLRVEAPEADAMVDVARPAEVASSARSSASASSCR